MDPFARRGMWDTLKLWRTGHILCLTTHYMDEVEMQMRSNGILEYRRSCFMSGTRIDCMLDVLHAASGQSGRCLGRPHCHHSRKASPTTKLGSTALRRQSCLPWNKPLPQTSLRPRLHHIDCEVEGLSTRFQILEAIHRPASQGQQLAIAVRLSRLCTGTCNLTPLVSGGRGR
eukprot:5032805-Amphidinium_carterae.1